MLNKGISLLLAMSMLLISTPTFLLTTAATMTLPYKFSSAEFTAASAGVGKVENPDPEKVGTQMAGPTVNGSYLEFDIDVPKTTTPDNAVKRTYTFTARVQSGGDVPSMRVLVDGNEVLNFAEGVVSGEGVAWFVTTPRNFEITRGTHKLRIEFKSTFDISWISLEHYGIHIGDQMVTVVDSVESARWNGPPWTGSCSDPDSKSKRAWASTNTNHWLEFDLYVSEQNAGLYDIFAKGATPETAGIKYTLTLDTEFVDTVISAGTGDWGSPTTWALRGPSTVNLSAGKHTLRFTYNSQFNLSLLKFARVMDEDDTIIRNASDYSSSDKTYKMESLAVGTNGYTGNPEITSGKCPTGTSGGSWLQYTVNRTAETAGDYRFTLYAASKTSSSPTMDYECYIDGKLVSIGSYPKTENWHGFTATDSAGVHLSEGSHTVRILFKSQFNLGLFKFEKLTVDPDASVTAVAIQGQNHTAIKGKTASFAAKVTGTEGFDPFVIWSISGGSASTIDNNGFLTVPYDETANTLTLTAKSRSHPNVVSLPVTITLTDETNDHTRLALETAREGVVLVQNNNNVLPLKNTDNVAVLGLGQVSYVKGGSGSGDVQSAYERTIMDGLAAKARKGSFANLDQTLADWYKNYYMTLPGASVGSNEPDYSTVKPMIDAAAERSNSTGIIVISRRFGEGNDVDMNNGSNSYGLSTREQELITNALGVFDKVVVVVNISSVIDMNWIVNAQNNGKKVDSIVIAWNPGMEGGVAVADVLCGDVNPSGKLTDTFVTKYSDYPSATTYSNQGRNSWVSYEEDIFTGYRYFETFAPNSVVFPFGFGLSYTTFTISDVTATSNLQKGTIEISAKVTNTGSKPGKEVVQVYYSAPSGKLPKAKMELAAFKKTGIINPGEHEIVTMSYSISDMASYDDIGKTGKQAAYVLEAGDYKVYVGNSVRNHVQAGIYTVSQLTITKQLTNVMQPTQQTQEPTREHRQLARRLNGAGSYEDTVWPANPITSAPFVQGPAQYSPIIPTTSPAAPDGVIKLADVAQNPSLMSAFLAQLTTDELAFLTFGSSGRGSIDGGPRDIIVGGITATTNEILKFGIPRLQTSDGPAGIRNSTYRSTTFPCGTMQACTWNTAIVEDVGAAMAEEAIEIQVLTQYLGLTLENHGSPILLSPGTNIHRDPKCARNFEYYSEDPYASGMMAAAQIKGIQSKGAAATIKHFAVNNSETNRKNSDSMVSERALREIYLKPFEIAIKSASPLFVMTSYNLINGEWASSNRDLMVTVLRDEWQFKGGVMTDWGSTPSVIPEINAGSTLKMPGIDSASYNTLKTAITNGIVTRAQLENLVRDLMYAELNTYLFEAVADKDAIKTYNPVSVKTSSGISANVDFNFYYENEPVQLHISNTSGLLHAIRVTDSQGAVIPVEDQGSGLYMFEMPDSAVDIEVVTLSESLRDSSLSDLTMTNPAVTGNLPLTPAFDSETTSYTMNVPYSVDGLTVNAVKSQDGAKVAISGNTSLTVGSTNTITITVTSEDGQNHTVYTINVTRAASDYTLSSQPNSSGWYKGDVTIAPTSPYAEIWDGSQWRGSLSVSSQADNTVSFKLRMAGGTESTQLTKAIKIDKTAPTGEIKVKNSSFKSFLNTITFGMFFKNTVNVSITGSDTLSGVETIEYQKVNDGASYDANGAWTSYTSLSIQPNAKCVIYARLTDKAGNVTIINSDGIVVYSDSAVTPTSAVFDKHTSSDGYKDINVTLALNGNTLKEIKNGDVVLVPGTEYTVAGNTITIKKEYLEQQTVEDITLTFVFNPMGTGYTSGGDNDAPAIPSITITVADTTPHQCDYSGQPWITVKEATCAEAGKEHQCCVKCGKPGPERDIPKTDDHMPGNWEVTKEPTVSEAGTRVKKCTVCGKVLETEDIPKLAEDVQPATLTDSKTSIRIDAPAGAVPSGTVLMVEPVLEGANFTIVANALEGKSDKISAFDIKLISNNVEIKPNGKVKVTIPVPSEFNVSKLALYHISDDGTTTQIDFKLDDNKKNIIFETGDFSYYAIAEVERGAKTGIGYNGVLLFTIMMAISACALVAARKRRTANSV